MHPPDEDACTRALFVALDRLRSPPSPLWGRRLLEFSILLGLVEDHFCRDVPDAPPLDADALQQRVDGMLTQLGAQVGGVAAAATGRGTAESVRKSVLKMKKGHNNNALHKQTAFTFLDQLARQRPPDLDCFGLHTTLLFCSAWVWADAGGDVAALAPRLYLSEDHCWVGLGDEELDFAIADGAARARVVDGGSSRSWTFLAGAPLCCRTPLEIASAMLVNVCPEKKRETWSRANMKCGNSLASAAVQQITLRVAVRAHAALRAQGGVVLPALLDLVAETRHVAELVELERAIDGDGGLEDVAARVLRRPTGGAAAPAEPPTLDGAVESLGVLLAAHRAAERHAPRALVYPLQFLSEWHGREANLARLLVLRADDAPAPLRRETRDAVRARVREQAICAVRWFAILARDVLCGVYRPAHKEDALLVEVLRDGLDTATHAADVVNGADSSVASPDARADRVALFGLTARFLDAAYFWEEGGRLTLVDDAVAAEQLRLLASYAVDVREAGARAAFPADDSAPLSVKMRQLLPLLARDVARGSVRQAARSILAQRCVAAPDATAGRKRKAPEGRRGGES